MHAIFPKQINQLIYKLPTRESQRSLLDFCWSSATVNKHLQKTAQTHFLHVQQTNHSSNPQRHNASAAKGGRVWKRLYMGWKCITKPRNRAYFAHLNDIYKGYFWPKILSWCLSSLLAKLFLFNIPVCHPGEVMRKLSHGNRTFFMLG